MRKWIYYFIITLLLFLIANYAGLIDMIINFPIDRYICFFLGTATLAVAIYISNRNSKDFNFFEKLKEKKNLKEVDLDDDDEDEKTPEE